MMRMTNKMKCSKPGCSASIVNGDSLYNCGYRVWKCLKHSGKEMEPIAQLIENRNKRIRQESEEEDIELNTRKAHSDKLS